MRSCLFILAVLLMSGCSTNNDRQKSSNHSKAQAQVLSSNKKINGVVSFEQKDKGVLMKANINGLGPNSVHAVHVHEKGICEAPYKSAGDHFNPTKMPHGAPGGKKKHVGDFGNLVADAKGNAQLELLLREDEVEEGVGLLLGKAVIVHAKPDDLRSQPSGNAGDRIACGIIEEQ